MWGITCVARNKKEPKILLNSEWCVVESLRDICLILCKGHSSNLATCRTLIYLYLVSHDICAITHIYHFLCIVKLVVCKTWESSYRHVLDWRAISRPRDESCELIVTELDNSYSSVGVYNHEIFYHLWNRPLHHIFVSPNYVCPVKAKLRALEKCRNSVENIRSVRVLFNTNEPWGSCYRLNRP